MVTRCGEKNSRSWWRGHLPADVGPLSGDNRRGLDRRESPALIQDMNHVVMDDVHMMHNGASDFDGCRRRSPEHSPSHSAQGLGKDGRANCGSGNDGGTL